MIKDQLTYSLVVAMLHKLVGSEYLAFDAGLRLNNCTLWAACAPDTKTIYVMDGDERWHQVDVSDSEVIAALYPAVEKLQIEADRNDTLSIASLN